MHKNKTVFLLAVWGLLVCVIACEATPTRRVEPTRASATVQAVSVVTEVVPTVTPQATSTPVWVDESNCRAACHIPDPNEEFAKGADPQPADHTGYKTCVECHLKLTKPAYPETHRGRMDPACPLCHVSKAKMDAVR